MFTSNSIVNIEALANKKTIEDKDRNQAPESIDTFVAIEIQTNGLSPTLQKGDMAICKPIENFSELIDHRIYAVVLENKTYVRRIINVSDKKGRTTHLQLYTDSPLDLHLTTVHCSQVSRIFRVVNKVSSL